MPPPLNRFSADEFRRWLAQMVSQDKPPTRSDRDSMKLSLIELLSVCPLVYGIDDRKTMWEKIGNAAAAALETCNGDLLEWVNAVLEGISASPGRVASCAPLQESIASLQSQDDSWRAECLRVLRSLWIVLPGLARARWESEVKTIKQQEFDHGNG